jgi:membrane protein
VLKRGFALYLVCFPSYEVIYGAISAIPIFLGWMYASWAVTLFGAEVAAALPEWRERQGAASGNGPGTG